MKSSCSYRVCHGLRLTNQDDYFRVTFDHFWRERHFFEANLFFWRSWGSRKSCLEPKTRPAKPSLTKFNQVKLVQIPDTPLKISSEYLLLKIKSPMFFLIMRTYYYSSNDYFLTNNFSTSTPNDVETFTNERTDWKQIFVEAFDK